MQNITIALEDNLAEWAQDEAARQGVSVSCLINNMLAEKMNEESSYQAATRRFLDGKTYNLRRPGERLPRREELYDRKVLR